MQIWGQNFVGFPYKMLESLWEDNKAHSENHIFAIILERDTLNVDRFFLYLH